MSGKNSASLYAQYKEQIEAYLNKFEKVQSETELNDLIKEYRTVKQDKPSKLNKLRRDTLNKLDEQIAKAITEKGNFFAQNEQQNQANDEPFPQVFERPEFEPFHKQYLSLATKAIAFTFKGKNATDEAAKERYFAAAKALCAVTTDIVAYVRTYEKDNNLSQLKQCVKARLNEKDNTDILLLKQHRGVAEILANLALAVFALPVYLVASAYQGTLFPIKLKTDSAMKLAGLNKAVEELNVADSSTLPGASEVSKVDVEAMLTVHFDDEAPSPGY